MTERKMVANSIRAIRQHKKIAKNSILIAMSYTGELSRYHKQRATKAARVARIEFESLY